MTRDPRYDVLIEPVQIGPVTARNRFYQVPHCNGMGRTFPSSMARMRGVKAEGGWAVIATEQIDIHPSADITPATEGRLWSDEDIPYLARMCDAVHEHNSLALIELTYNGKFAPNMYSREVPMFPSHMPVVGTYPVQARAMDKQDIRDYRRWHLDAVKRSKKAGFDIVCCYAAHNLSLAGQFMLRRYNHRTDEYGGSLENRVRLFREIIEDAKEAVGDTMGVVVRFAVDELRGDEGMEKDKEGREVIEMLAELPDLWDVNVAEWHNDSQTSRFRRRGFPGTVYRVRQEGDDQTGCGSRPLHLSRPHGLRYQQGHHGHDRGGAPVNCRSVPAHKRSRKAASRTSASASVATFASAGISRQHPCAAPRTRPRARNGARAGTLSASIRSRRTTPC